MKIDKGRLARRHVVDGELERRALAKRRIHPGAGKGKGGQVFIIRDAIVVVVKIKEVGDVVAVRVIRGAIAVVVELGCVGDAVVVRVALQRVGIPGLPA